MFDEGVEGEAQEEEDEGGDVAGVVAVGAELLVEVVGQGGEVGVAKEGDDAQVAQREDAGAGVGLGERAFERAMSCIGAARSFRV